MLYPLPISLPSDISSPILTFSRYFIYRDYYLRVSSPSNQPEFSLGFHEFLPVHSVKCFSRSTNTAHISLSFSIYLYPIVRINPIASLVPFLFLKPNCSSSNSSSILESRRRFSIHRIIFAVCDTRLIVLNSLHFFILFFFGIVTNTVSMNSSGHLPSL